MKINWPHNEWRPLLCVNHTHTHSHTHKTESRFPIKVSRKQKTSTRTGSMFSLVWSDLAVSYLQGQGRPSFSQLHMFVRLQLNLCMCDSSGAQCVHWQIWTIRVFKLSIKAIHSHALILLVFHFLFNYLMLFHFHICPHLLFVHPATPQSPVWHQSLPTVYTHTHTYTLQQSYTSILLHVKIRASPVSVMEHRSMITLVNQLLSCSVLLLQKSNGRLHQIINSDCLGCVYIKTGYMVLFVFWRYIYMFVMWQY